MVSLSKNFLHNFVLPQKLHELFLGLGLSNDVLLLTLDQLPDLLHSLDPLLEFVRFQQLEANLNVDGLKHFGSDLVREVPSCHFPPILEGLAELCVTEVSLQDFCLLVMGAEEHRLHKLADQRNELCCELPVPQRHCLGEEVGDVLQVL